MQAPRLFAIPDKAPPCCGRIIRDAMDDHDELIMRKLRADMVENLMRKPKEGLVDEIIRLRDLIYKLRQRVERLTGEKPDLAKL